jgi:hypothetical protein
MKRFLLLLALIAGFSQLKAQQFFPAKPADSTTYSLDKLLKISPVKPFELVKPDLNLTQVFNNTLTLNTGANIDHMPVAVLDGFSKMPVVKIGGYYTMPVKKIGSEEVLTGNQNLLRGLPTFKTP